MEDKTDMGYSALYSHAEEENDDKAKAFEDYKQRGLERRGKTISIVLGILMLIPMALCLTGVFSMSNAAEAVGYILGIAIPITIVVLFMKGINWARIVTGIILAIQLVLYIIFSVMYFNTAQLLGMTGYFIAIDLILLAIYAVPTYLILFSKSIKAYCRSKQQAKSERGN